MTITINTHEDLDAVLHELRIVYPNLANLYFKDAKSIVYYSKTIKELYGLDFILNASIVSNLHLSRYSDICLIGIMYGHIQIDAPVDLSRLCGASSIRLNNYQHLPFPITNLSIGMSNVDLSGFDVDVISLMDNDNIFIENENTNVSINGKTSFYGKCSHIDCSFRYYVKDDFHIFAEFKSIKIMYLNHPLLA